ncbi:hypothetical protein ZEAMMB73_Zm00001d038788 [Zea mays]|uniref:Uncharacterized protein n=1 Tax=Zea mays TaxID=4577 RepID=A0A1D6MAK6_MAIZE|nr:hypothetical protein ZEAMMB73_Zm00001d038788 [Zea mays]
MLSTVVVGTDEAYEPQRRSCDVRGRSNLWALIHQDNRQWVRGGTAFEAFSASSFVIAAALTVEVLLLAQPSPPPACVPKMFILDEFTALNSMVAGDTAAVEEDLCHRSSSHNEGVSSSTVKARKDWRFRHKRCHHKRERRWSASDDDSYR